MTGQPDIVIVGAGIGGIYAIIRLRRLGFSVVGLESADEVGGVWYHNNYPGSRVDLESDTYCYFFDEELYRDWSWSERYAAQPEVLDYLKHVADRFDVYRSLQLGTRVVSARWQPATQRWLVETDRGPVLEPRFLVMATGQLSRPRDPDFAGLHDFQGEWYQTAQWPKHDVNLKGKRVGVIGTGSSGVQTITAVAAEAGHLTVFQRTPNYSIPAQNRPPDGYRRRRLLSRFPHLWDDILSTGAGTFMPPPAGKAADFPVEEQYQLMQQRWDFGSQSMLGVFTDQLTDWTANELVSEFVRDKVRDAVRDPRLRSALVPDSYPMGTKRLILDTGYYEVFGQENVELVNLRQDPLRRITAAGVETHDRHVDLDVIIFAIGFEAFTGALDDADLANDAGIAPTSLWQQGPQTYLGLQTHGFPNLFFLSAPGSTSVLANLYAGNSYQVDWIGELLLHMRSNNRVQVQATPEAQERWGGIQAAAAEHLIRRQVNNYMVRVNDDGSRVYIPYGGGLNSYVAHCVAETASGYRGFAFA
ncbi:NAD(P)/FAD-dependent oxidoreductase [Dactylosporangium sp. NPDC005572]|uniref:flavin-containing monooxygenase n=1 Tax=Dactylosporangium sp. NPDC005572 TaxID=3156889 RepID=UPI0033A46407